MRPVLLSDIAERRISTKESIILRELLLSPFASRERLIDQLWGQDEDGGPLCAAKTIDVYVYRLRRALRPPWWICVEHGQGLRLVRDESIPPEMRQFPIQLQLRGRLQKQALALIAAGNTTREDLASEIYGDHSDASLLNASQLVCRIRRITGMNISVGKNEPYRIQS